MAVTPLLAHWKVTIDYTVDALSHKQDLLCTAVAAGGAPSGYNFVTFDSTALDVNVGVQAYALLLAAILPASNGTVDSFTLLELVSGAYLPRYSNAIGVAGTNTNPRSVANRFTAVFRAISGQLVREVVMGVGIDAPRHAGMGGGSGSFVPWWNDFVDNTTTHVGNWAVGRGNVQLVGKTLYTVSLDRKSRRRLNLI